jgi:hypothetical protein
LAEKHAPEQFKKVDAFFDVIPEPEASLFGAVPVPPPAPKTDTYPFLRIGDIVNRPPPVYLVRRHIPEISVGFLYSVPGAGKTFLALDAALHIAYARMFRNDMHNVSLREEIDRRAWERREEHIQSLRNVG